MLHLQLSERDVEQLLAGDQPQGRNDLAEVARFVARLRALSDIESSPPMNPRLLAELDLAEAEQTTVETPDELEGWRELERRRTRTAKRRWRVVGAAAMVASLGGVVAAAQAQGSDSSPPSVEVDDETGPTTIAPPTSRPEASNGPKQPSTTVPPVTEEQPTTPPVEQPPTGQNDPGQIDSPGSQNGEQSEPRDWTQCGVDPECWMTAWPQFVPGSDRP